LLGNTVYGHIYYGCVAKKIINEHTKQTQRIICFGDYHDKKHPANANQRVQLESLLKKCAALKGKCIVEDLSSVNNDGRMICCNFGINCTEGILGHLARKIRELGISVDNVEFRYCRVASIGPLLNNIHADPFSLKSTATIMTSSLHKEVADELEKIQKYDDGKQLNNFYKKAVLSVRSALLNNRLCAGQKCTVAQYCSQLRSKHYRKELEKLCIFDSALIDMNILHAIAASPTIPLIFVFAGGSHVEQVSAMLQRIGYELEFEISHFHPQPIDISVIDKFIR
jgi:hypothetical protein